MAVSQGSLKESKSVLAMALDWWRGENPPGGRMTIDGFLEKVQQKTGLALGYIPTDERVLLLIYVANTNRGNKGKVKSVRMAAKRVLCASF